MSIDNPSKFVCELCGGTHPTSEHKLSGEPEPVLEKKEERQEIFLEALNERISMITGNLEAQGWKKLRESTGRDQSYNPYSTDNASTIRTYLETYFQKDGWEIEKTDYDPERGHLIFDIRGYVVDEADKKRQGNLYHAPRLWTARIELWQENDEQQMQVYLRGPQVAGFHFTDKKFDRVGRYKNLRGGPQAEHSKNYRTFNWDPQLIEKYLPPITKETKRGTTNVLPEELNYDSYEAEKYDDDIRRSIPGYEEMHQKIDDTVAEYVTNNKVDKVLDLGIGTGLTAERLLKFMPDATLTAVDFSEQMMRGAEKRLADAKVKFLIGDYSEIDFGKDYEVVASVIGLHHQNDEGKKKMFQKIYDALKPGGIFIFGDLVTYGDENKAKQNEEKHFQFLHKNARDEKSLREWEHHHRTQNLLTPIERQIEWLKKTGFSEVDVKFEHLNTALIIAKK